MLLLDGNASGHAVREEQKSLLLPNRLSVVRVKGPCGSMTSQGADRQRRAHAGAVRSVFGFHKDKLCDRFLYNTQEDPSSDSFV